MKINSAWLRLIIGGAIAFLLVLGIGLIQFITMGQGVGLTVSAAASLTDVLNEIKPIYEKSRRVTLTYNFAASGPLVQQIEQGAPVDIFISAATRQMNQLASQGLLLSQKSLLSNELVLVIPSQGVNVSKVTDLIRPSIQKIAVGEFRSVPVGLYTKEVFQNLKILAQVESKLVFGNSVRQVLSFVESGNADVGMVYITDAKIAGNVKVAVKIPKNLHSPILYPIAILKRTQEVKVAEDFVGYLSGRDAQKIWTKYGFQVLK